MSFFPKVSGPYSPFATLYINFFGERDRVWESFTILEETQGSGPECEQGAPDQQDLNCNLPEGPTQIQKIQDNKA
jgi:hypothetical protein